MRPVLKFLHLVGVIVFMGVLAAELGWATIASSEPLGSEPVLQELAARAAAWLLIPALLLAVVAGLLAVAVHRPFMDAPWVWIKALLGMLIASIALFGVQPALQGAVEAAHASRAGPGAGAAELGSLAAAWGSVRGAGWLALGLSIGAVALGVWRPRLGRPRGS